MFGAAQDRQSVGGRAETDVPNNKCAGMPCQPLHQPQLIQVKRLSFGDRANDGVKGLALDQGMNTGRTIGKSDKFVRRLRRHALIVKRLRPFGKQRRAISWGQSLSLNVGLPGKDLLGPKVARLCRRNLEPKDRPAAADPIPDLHVLHLPPGRMAVGKQNIASGRLSPESQMTRRVIRDNSAGAANLSEAAGIFLDHDIGENFNRGGISHNKLRLKGFRRNHVGRVGTLALDQAGITEHATVASIIPPLIDGSRFVIGVKRRAVQNVPPSAAIDQKIAHGTIDVPKPLAAGRAGAWQAVSIIQAVNVHRDANLPQVADTFGASPAFSGRRECRQQHRRENCNDRNHNQKLDQRKSLGSPLGSMHNHGLMRFTVTEAGRSTIERLFRHLQPAILRV